MLRLDPGVIDQDIEPGFLEAGRRRDRLRTRLTPEHIDGIDDYCQDEESAADKKLTALSEEEILPAASTVEEEVARK